MVLPVTNSLLLLDPATAKVRVLADLRSTGLRAPWATADAGGAVAVAGGAPGGIAVVDIVSGRVKTSIRPTDVGFNGEGLTRGPDGLLYVSADYAAPKLQGAVLRFDPETLRLVDEHQVAYGQTANGAFDAGGSFWTVAQEARGPDPYGVSVLDPSSGRSTFVPLPAAPLEIVNGAKGRMVITLYRRNAVVELDGRGRLTRELPGLDEGPWGIAVGPDGRGVVVTEGSRRMSGRVYFVDFNEMEITGVRPADPCEVPREAVIVDSRLVVSCVGPPGALIMDVTATSAGRFISFAPWTRTGVGTLEEPRGLSVIRTG